MTNVWIILGNDNTRKSSTIRALTGLYRKHNDRRWEIETTSGKIIRFWIEISALQEHPISAKDFIKEMEKRGHQNILLPLWIRDRKRTIYPEGWSYIESFVKAEWKIKKIVFLGVDGYPYSKSLPKGCPAPKYVEDAKSSPSNSIASKIRKWWRWL